MSRNRPPRDALRFIRGNNLVFALTDLLGNFARGMVMPYTSLYILALGGDTTQIGLVNSIRPLAGLVMFPVGGYIADHARRVRLVVLRDIRGRVMAALGHGGLKIGTAGGGVGGPSVGYIAVLPLMAASLAGGYLYAWEPVSPWFCAAIATVLSISLIALFVRDPRQAER